MADRWEMDTLGAVNERRTELGLPTLEWSTELESEARNYWTDPSLAPNVVRICNCPHWTPPKEICRLLWCDELAHFRMKHAAIVIFNDRLTHAALALTSGEVMKRIYHKEHRRRHKNGRRSNNMSERSGRMRPEPTRPVQKGTGLVGRITGREQATAIRNKYQPQLDWANAAIVNEVHHTEDTNRARALEHFNQAQALKEDIKARQAERAALVDTLDAQIDKERGQEYRMWKASPQGLKINTTEGLKSEAIQAGIGVVGTTTPAPVLRYLEQYPKLASSPFVLEIIGKIERKEEEIRRKVEAYDQSVANFNRELPFYEKNVLKCKENLARYHRILEEYTREINNCRYLKSVAWRMLPQAEKDQLLPETLPHTIEKWESMIALFEKDLSQYQKRPFTELPYS